MNRGADCVEHLAWRLAPEQGTLPDTAHRSFKLRLPDRRTAPVSTAIVRKNKTKAAYTFPQNQWLQ